MGAGAALVSSVLEHTGQGHLLSRGKGNLITSLSLFVCSHLERQLQQRNLHNACGGAYCRPKCSYNSPGSSHRHPTVFLVFGDLNWADCNGITMSAYSVPCLLGRFLVRTPPVTLCRKVEKSHRVPREQRLYSSILVFRIYFLLREQTVSGLRQNCSLTRV